MENTATAESSTIDPDTSNNSATALSGCAKFITMFASINANFSQLRGEDLCWELVRVGSTYLKLNKKEGQQACDRSPGWTHWAYNVAHGDQDSSEGLPHSPELDRTNIQRATVALKRNPSAQGLVYVAHTLWNEQPTLLESHIPTEVAIERVFLELYDSNGNFAINWPADWDQGRYAGMVNISAGSHEDAKRAVLELCQKSISVIGVWAGSGGTTDQARADAVFAALDECTSPPAWGPGTRRDSDL